MDFSFQPAEKEEEVLKKYGRNINQDVINNKIDPIIGREDEIRRLIEIISRKTKNNPVLIGEPGVGKTAIVEGLAQRIVNGDVPEQLKNREIWEISLANLIAGASFQGEFEKRINAIINHAKKSNGKIILFIDEIHQLIGTGKTSNGSAMDAANILKPQMARGDIKLIGATTVDEYRQYIEKDRALERRMQKIVVNEPSVQEALTILRGLKERWELFHKVKIHDAALVSAVTLSDRYIADKFLPDKAIDLVDEAAAKVKTEMYSLPSELAKINRLIIDKETEKVSLSDDADPNAKKRLAIIDTELNNLKLMQKKANDDWMHSKQEHDRLIAMKTDLEIAKNRIDRLQQEGEFEKASKLLYIEIPNLEKEIHQLEEKINSQNSSFKDAVGAKEIAMVISRATGIQLSKLTLNQNDKLAELPGYLKSRVIGQERAVSVVSDAILRSKAGVNDPNRPIGSFLFLGPTGVGKTELAKSLAYALFDTEKAMIRFDMSEYMEKHSVAKLIGSPPGYVGYEQPGLLSNAVRLHPYSVLLFDEIDKAHPDILNLLLQILDDGVLHDAKGNIINFKNTIIIMTSNIGAQEILDGHPSQAIEVLKKFVRPEFINRIDEVVTFNQIEKDNVAKIAEKLLSELTERLVKDDIHIVFEKSVIAKVAKDGFDPIYGARPLKRFIQSRVENFLAQQIIEGQIKKNIKYATTVDKNGGLIIKEARAD